MMLGTNVDVKSNGFGKTGTIPQTNVQFGNSKNNPVVFQHNDCDYLTNTAFNQGCVNESDNHYKVNNAGGTSATKPTTIDVNHNLQVQQVNDCNGSEYTTAKGAIGCANVGLESVLTDSAGNDWSTLGPATTIFSADASGFSATGTGSNVKGNYDSNLKMTTNCDNSRNEGLSGTDPSSCINAALNEAHYVALGGGQVTVNKAVETSNMAINYNNIDNGDAAYNEAVNTFAAEATNGGIINIGNVGATLTNTLNNNCNDADCEIKALNSLLLMANDGSKIQTTSTSTGLKETNTLTTNCSTGAECSLTGQNTAILKADGLLSDILIKDLTLTNSHTLACSNGEVCSYTDLNDVFVFNDNSGESITVDTQQSNILGTSPNPASAGSDTSFNQLVINKVANTPGTFMLDTSQRNTQAGFFNSISGSSGSSCVVNQLNGGPSGSNPAVC